MPHGAVLFQAFLKAPQLVFHFFNSAIQGSKYSIGLIDRYEFVVMLGPHP
jgi:hypothetical protein